MTGTPDTRGKAILIGLSQLHDQGRKHVYAGTVPASEIARRRNPTPRPVVLTDDELAEDVEWIVDWDTPPSIAARVGYRTIDGLVGRLRRAGRGDLVERLLAGQGRLV